ncbi:MAG: hypothetical protein KGP12_11860 [Actinomycetales bacterium]|nr:hypothetical protein [Actinomycetales bacterium]
MLTGRGSGPAAEARILERIPAGLLGTDPAIVVPCEHRQGLVITQGRIIWVGVGADGRRARRAPAWSAGIDQAVRVLWNRIDILDRQELTIRLEDRREVMVAPLREQAWERIRPAIEADPGWRSWPTATLGERMGGFLPPDRRGDRSTYVFVDSDRIVRGEQEHLVDGSTRAALGYRPAMGSAPGALRSYSLADLFTRTSASGMEPYVRLTGDGWQIEMAISMREAGYAASLVDRINALAAQR